MTIRELIARGYNIDTHIALNINLCLNNEENITSSITDFDWDFTSDEENEIVIDVDIDFTMP